MWQSYLLLVYFDDLISKKMILFINNFFKFNFFNLPKMCVLCFVNYDQLGMSHAGGLVDCRREREILLKVRLGFSDDGARAILRGYNGN